MTDRRPICLTSAVVGRRFDPPLVAVALVLLLISIAAARPVEVDVTGTWEMSVESKDGTAHPSITLKQDRDSVIGTYRGQMGESKLDGTIKGNEIRFTVTLRFQDLTYTVIYTGTVSEDAMKGTARFGDSGTGNWSAKRRKNRS